MKKLFSIILFILTVTLIQAQSTTEEDFNQMKREMEEQLKSFKVDIEGAMGEMQQLMESLRSDGLDKRDIIINGDTIILAPSMEMFERLDKMDLSSLFRQIPENMQDMDLFFGGDGASEMFDLMDEFRNKTLELETDDNPTENDTTPENKKKGRQKKTYSL